ncbi:MAG: DUF4097 family beta strand repeat-containing protein [Acidobacteriota bacterium]
MFDRSVRPRLLRRLPLLAGFLVACLTSLPLLAAERTWSETYPLSAGGSVGLENVNGDLVVEVWDRAEVSIDATIEGRSATAVDALEIEVSASDQSIEIETYSPGKSWGSDDGIVVDFVLRMPRGAHLDDVTLVNGSLTVEGVEGDVEASLVNGNLLARDLGGSADLESVNGGIEASFTRLDASDSIDVEAVNGSVLVILPANLSATIDAETVHGSITNSFGLEIEKGRWVGAELDGVVGGGGATVSIENVNGSIEIESR